mgnify:FL=1
MGLRGNAVDDDSVPLQRVLGERLRNVRFLVDINHIG